MGPLGAALVALAEILHVGLPLALNLGAVPLALCAAALVGFPLGLIAAGIGVMVARRGSADRFASLLPAVTAALFAAALAAVGGWLVVDLVIVAARKVHLFDFAEYSDSAITVAVVVLAPMALSLAVLVTLAAMNASWFVRFGPALRRVCLGFLACLGLYWILKPILITWSGTVPVVTVAAVGLSAAIGMAILPRSVQWTRLNLAFNAAAAVLLLALGLLGLQRPGPRAFLLHDTRAFTTYLDFVSIFDVDGDGVAGGWFGGDDCNDFDAAVSPAAIEIPSNGIDDNCYGGDSTPLYLSTPVPKPQKVAKQIFLLTIDSVRADHLASQGYHRDTMPRLEAFAKAACLSFPRAYAPSNHTATSMFSSLSGQTNEYITRLKWDKTSFAQHPLLWLPDGLNAAGVDTLGINIPAEPLNLDDKSAGFRFRETRRSDLVYFRSRATTSIALRDTLVRRVRERESDRPLFSWVHFTDPHAFHISFDYFKGGTTIDQYDSELAHVDFALMGAIDSIREVYPESVFIIVSDHGEEFGERGRYGHGFSVLQSEVHVPLLICAPHLPAAVREDLVSTGGIAATVHELFDLPAPPLLQYPSLLRPSSDTAVVVGNTVFGSVYRMENALVEERFKLHHNRRRRTFVLFDLLADPNETKNVFDQHPETAARMKETLMDRLERLL